MSKAVIFDWDGTLADTKEAILSSFHTALMEIAGIDVSDEFIERRIGVGASWTFREILESKGIEVDEETLNRLVAAKIRVVIEEIPKVTLFPGARILLESLCGQAKMGLASMNNRQVIDELLPSLKVQHFFDVVVTVDEVTKSKPDPEIFLVAAKRLKEDPPNCVVVEDSIFGVKAAKAAKMACIAVSQGAYTSTELAKENPDLIVNSLLEKNAILKLIIS